MQHLHAHRGVAAVQAEFEKANIETGIIIKSEKQSAILRYKPDKAAYISGARAETRRFQAMGQLVQPPTMEPSMPKMSNPEKPM